MTVFLTDLKGDNPNFMVLYVKSKVHWVLRSLVLCYVFFSFHKVRPQKSRQAISCYFVFSHLWSYLHSILIMLFRKGSSYSKYLFFRSQDFLSPHSSALHYPDQAITETASMLLRQNCIFL